MRDTDNIASPGKILAVVGPLDTDVVLLLDVYDEEGLLFDVASSEGHVLSEWSLAEPLDLGGGFWRWEGDVSVDICGLVTLEGEWNPARLSEIQAVAAGKSCMEV